MTVETPIPSTLSGWLPEPGTYAWMQMYSPQQPACDSTIEERLAAGETYGRKTLVRLLAAVPYDDTGLTRYITVEADRPYTEATIQTWIHETPHHGWFHPGMGATESDWCVLWPADAQTEAGVLF